MAVFEKKGKERFSLLLLEPGEIYFEDFSVYYYPIDLSENEAIRRRQKGRLKVCSKSVLFDPSNLNCPILKFPLQECSQIEKWKGPLMSKIDNKGNVIIINCNQVMEMLEGNSIAPYIVKKKKQEYLFSLNYVTVDDCLPQICQLHRASTLPGAEQAAMIAVIVLSRQSRVSFNACWLEDFHENIILEAQGNRITPLVVNPGRILLTNSRLYFQPFNNAEPLPVFKINLSHIKRIRKRRFLLRQMGLELFCSEDSIAPHLFLTLKTTAERDKLYESIMEQPAINLEDSGQENMTLLWQNGIISNYEYLMYLNSMADRSFNDLTQYPVFPWIICNYSSRELNLSDPANYRDLQKPIGALQIERLERLKERYRDMTDPKFLYGSHYSTPGFVLYYLVRKVPQYMLCLQNGRFDHPDRMFNSVSDTWKNVTTNTADFKEMIPEFYQPENKGDFLVNSMNLNFGIRQDGVKVGNVELPPWARSPADFIQKLRDALESDYVSNHLHHWIDLIFGYKQRGEEAIKADNVFYYLTYEGAVDLDNIKDVNERYCLEVQINEFGQIPKQIFSKPHPHRISTQIPAIAGLRLLGGKEDKSTSDIEPTIADNVDTSSVPEDFEQPKDKDLSWKDMETLQINIEYRAHRGTVEGIRFAEDSANVFSVSQDSFLKMYAVEEQKQQRSINISNMALSSCVAMPDGKTVLVGSWDNNVYTYSIEYGKVSSTTFAHDDAVSDLCWNNNFLSTCSWDSTVKIWKYIPDYGLNSYPTVEILAEFDHDTPVECISINKDNSFLISGTRDGQIYVWDVNTGQLVTQIQAHTGKVYAVSFSPDGLRMVSCGDNLKVFDFQTKSKIFSKEDDEELRCLCWDGATILAGGNLGNLMVWDLIVGQLRAKIPGHNGPVTCIDVCQYGSTVATGGEDRRVVTWKKPH